MNNYDCKIIADSLNTFGDRLTTFKLTYPRIVHAELMTHRLFSRNAASSRAVPVKKLIESVKNNMFIPLSIQKKHKGMQGSEYFEGQELEHAKQLWIESAELALQQAEKMNEFGITKQLINRILEPYQYYQVLVTATEWENFFNLRCPRYNSGKDGSTQYFSKKDYCKDNGVKEEDYNDFYWRNVNDSQADIHIQSIAELMWDTYNESSPKQLKEGEWHIPFGDNIDLSNFNFGMEVQSNKFQKNLREQTKIKIATARCARISYETLGDNPKIDYISDVNLHDRLLNDGHMSPLEHCARAMTKEEYILYTKTFPGPSDKFKEDVGHQVEIDSKQGLYTMEKGWCRNFIGFIQYRHLV